MKSARSRNDADDAPRPDPTGRAAAGAGFTLIEVLVALSILTISVVVLLRLHVLSIRHVDIARQLARASMLADEKMAEALAAPLREIGEHSETVTMDELGLDMTWTVTVSDADLEELRSVAVTQLLAVSVR